ncbi:MAG: C10 family peptidase [Deltaproteobacteria bacterium]|nr:C10 family peptidase [Deltaproteobacteria bacterium]
MTNTMWRLFILLLSFGLLCPPSSPAAPVTPTMVEQVGQTQLTAQNQVACADQAKRGIAGYQDRTVASIGELKNSRGDTLAYVLTLSPTGYIVISTDTDITPIIAQSHDSNFIWEDSPANVLLHLVTLDMENRLKALPETGAAVKQANNTRWNNYVAADGALVSQITRAATYGPLLSPPTWNQDSPYNGYCPMDPVTQTRSLTGCVATAMAQIVNYYERPVSVTFLATDNYTTDTRKIDITASTADIAGITYPAGGDMAARLSYACGVSVKMDYTSAFSGAYTKDLAWALRYRFGYVSAIYKDTFNDSIYPIIQNNIKNRQPVNLAITDISISGHSIVCDGYNDGSGQYHLNFGWGGTTDGWYSLPYGMPEQYMLIDNAVTDIRPNGTPIRYDFDGNGQSDMLWYNSSTGQSVAWLMNGTSIASYGKINTVSDLNWKIQGVGDFNGDGKADILWRNEATGQVWMYLMNGASIASQGSVGTVDDLSWQIQGVADFNGDGKADILWRNVANGDVYIWLMNGMIPSSKSSVGAVGNLDWQIQGVGDFDGDGKADILWRNVANGDVYIWLMNGMIPSSKSSVGAVGNLDWQIQGVGDFDGDGKADILWRNVADGEVYIWLMNGMTPSSKSSVGVVGDLNWKIQGIGDFNGDGKADILWRNSSTGQVWMYLMNGASIASQGPLAIINDSNWQTQLK